MLVVSLLWYKKLRKGLEQIGFKFNPYDPFVANRQQYKSQHTILFYVDDIKSSHVKKEVNDEFHRWLNKMYGKYRDVKVYCGKKHEYLGMNFDFSEKDKVKIDMCEYISNMVEDFREYIKKDDYATTPAGNNIYKRDDSPELDKKRAEEFHTFVAKVFFAC